MKTITGNTEAEIVEKSDNEPEEVHIEAPVVQKVNTPKASNSSKKKSVKKALWTLMTRHIMP